MCIAKVDVCTSRAPAPVGTYSQALITGNLIFVSGQVGKDPVSGEISKDISLQTKQTLNNIQNILSEAGVSMSDVVKTNIYLVDMEDFAVFERIYHSFFDKPYPSRTTVQCCLSGEKRIEIDAIAIQKNN